MRKTVIGLMMLGTLSACSGGDPMPAGDSQSAWDEKFEVRDGMLFFEGDINLGPVENFEGSPSEGQYRTQSAGVFDLSRGRPQTIYGKAWPYNAVYWRFDPLFDRDATDNDEGFVAAVQHYNENTTLNFVEVAPTYAGPHILVTRREDAGKCWSHLGYQGETQRIEIGPAGCDIEMSLHELGHAIGLIHEHQRPDRDNYVFAWPSIVGDDSIYWTKENPNDVFLVSDYDIDSVMHYNSDDIPVPGGLVDLNGNPINRPRNKLTPRDINGIQIMYGNELQKTVTAVRRNSTTTDVFGRGIEGQVVWGTRTATSWTGFQLLGAPNGGRTIGAVDAASAGGRVDLVVRGSDHRLYHKYFNGTSWFPSQTGWNSVNSPVVTSDASITKWTSNRIDIFVRGDNPPSVRHAWTDNGGSSWGWEDLGGRIIGKPQAVAFYIPGGFSLPGNPVRVERMGIDIIVVGTDHGLFYKSYRNPGWWVPTGQGWTSIGGWVTGMPKVASWQPDRLDVFFKDPATYRLKHKSWEPSRGWLPAGTASEDLGDEVVGNPEVTPWGANYLDIFFQGPNGDLRQKTWNGSGWAPSQLTSYALGAPTGGRFVGSPTVTITGPDENLFVRSTSNQGFHKRWTGSGWTGFDSLGGGLTW